MTDDSAKLQAAYDAWQGQKAKDIEVWLDLIHPACRIASLAQDAPEPKLAAPASGRDGARVYLEALTRHWEMIEAEMKPFAVDGDRFVYFGEVRWRNRETGREVRTLKADLWTFRDGQAVDYVELYDTAAMIAAAS